MADFQSCVTPGLSLEVSGVALVVSSRLVFRSNLIGYSLISQTMIMTIVGASYVPNAHLASESAKMVQRCLASITTDSKLEGLGNYPSDQEMLSFFCGPLKDRGS
jgi:hypothetical protein